MNIGNDEHAQQERISLAREDLVFIFDEFTNLASEATLRRATSILRRLLVDGLLQRAWKDSGHTGQPTIPGIDFEAALAKHKILDQLIVAFAGGAHRGEFQEANSFVWNGNYDDHYSTSPEPPLIREYPLRVFLEAPCIHTGPRPISRHTVIKYVANKLGGVHFDQKRGKDQEEISFAILDRLTRDPRFLVMDTPVVYNEILAIGQSLNSSNDLESFRKAK